MIAFGLAGPSVADEIDGFSIDDEIFLDPIIVTGLKRLDEATELTTSVQVIDGDSLTTDAIDPGAAITRATPNFYYGGFNQPGNDILNMRGVGPLGQPANSLDNTIGVATNSVGSSSFGFPPSLLDVERIEVLRGPQGTLFGRNALAGAVNVVTKPADGTREFSIGGEIGTEGYWLGEAKAGGWISEGTVAGRAAVRFQQQDGDIPNAVVGGHEGDMEIAAARGSLRFLPGNDVTIDVVVGADRNKNETNYNMLKEQPTLASGADLIPENSRDRVEGTVEIVKPFENVTFTSISGLQNLQLEGKNDVGDELVFLAAFGFMPPRGADLIQSNDKEWIINQEFRLNSRKGERVSWVAGVNYFRSLFDSDRVQDSSFSPYSSGHFDTEIDSQTFAVFGDVTYPVTDAFSISGGLRLAHDYQTLSTRYTGRGFPGTVSAFSQDDSTSDTYLTGRGAISYDWSDSVMTYASIAHGYASGGFERYTLNAAVGEKTSPFKLATMWTYELGMKSQLWQDRIELNFSAFYNDVSDGQLVAADISVFPVIFSFVNQDYETYGFELEGRAAPTDALELGAGIGFTEAKINNVQADAVPGIVEGNAVPNAPNLTGFFDVKYSVFDNVYVIGQYQYVGDRPVDVQNTADLEAYSMVNARIGWENETFNVYAFVNNLLDERPEYFGSTYSPAVHTVTVGPGRVFGAGMKVRF